MALVNWWLVASPPISRVRTLLEECQSIRDMLCLAPRPGKSNEVRAAD